MAKAKNRSKKAVSKASQTSRLPAPMQRGADFGFSRADVPSYTSGARAVGTSLNPWTNHYRNGFFQGPDHPYILDYEAAFRNDEVIRQAIIYIALTMVASLGPYTHDDSRARVYVAEAERRMEGNWKSELFQLIVSALVSGLGGSEMILVADKGKVWLRRMANYHPRSLVLVPDDKGLLVEGRKTSTHPIIDRSGVWQEIPWTRAKQLADRLTTGTSKTLFKNYLKLPMNKMVLVAHNKRYGNHYGESALTPVWKHYMAANELERNYLITSERYASPQLAVFVPKGNTSVKVADPTAPSGMRFKTYAEAAQETVAGINLHTGMVFEEPPPPATGTGNREMVRVQPLSSFNNFGESFLAGIDHFQRRILIGLGVPPLILGFEHEGGLSGGAIAQVHADTYKQYITSLYHEFVEPFTEQCIGRLLKMNFGIDDPGEFTFNPYDLAAAETMAATFEKAVDYGALDPSIEEDLQLMRTRLGIPAASKETLPQRLRNNTEMMKFVRRPEKDKIAVAEIRAEATVEAAEIASGTSKHVANKQSDTMLKVADKNNEAKTEHEKIKADAQKHATTHATKQAAMQHEQVMSGQAHKLAKIQNQGESIRAVAASKPPAAGSSPKPASGPAAGANSAKPAPKKETK